MPARAATGLGPDELHIWRVAVRQPEERLERWRRLLTPPEQAKLARFHFPDDARRELVSRGALRELLGGYLGADGATLRFGTEAKGKPFLADMPPGERIEFNTSHSGDWALLGFARGRALGVDVERWRELESMEIVRGYFSPAEIAEWEAVPAAGRQPAFFDGWTRKESYLKALGTGLAKPLDSFQVRLARGEPAALVADAGDAQAAARWRMLALPMGEGYSAAVTVAAGVRATRAFEFG